MAYFDSPLHWGTHDSGLAGLLHGSIYFQKYNILNSVDFKSLFCQIRYSNNVQATVSFLWGLYTLTGSTLSLLNTVSFSTNAVNFNGINRLHSATNTSSGQTIVPGTYFWGLLVRTSSANPAITIIGQGITFFPAALSLGFLGGRFATTDTILPTSVATSDLTVLYQDQISNPSIVISA